LSLMESVRKELSAVKKHYKNDNYVQRILGFDLPFFAEQVFKISSDRRNALSECFYFLGE